MRRQISQREYDAQERCVAEWGRQAAAYTRETSELARLIQKYPTEARKLLRSA